MYLDYFGLKDLPFSIAPDPRFLFMSERHREALAHLLYGVSGQGGFVLLTGEVGTGKTTICRCFLEQVPKNTDVAFIVNPKLSARELLASICDEFHIEYHSSASIKKLNDQINEHLLKVHAVGRHTVLIIDEAQNLRVDVLEQLRLLTNLETSEKKLLQIVLLGQPELREILAKSELRQLSQRITARYHLTELNKEEVHAYVKARLRIAGRRVNLFTVGALNKLYRLSGGVPRIINLISDRALLGAYASSSELVEKKHIGKAYKEIVGEKIKVKEEVEASGRSIWIKTAGAFAIVLIAVGLLLPEVYLKQIYESELLSGLKTSASNVEAGNLPGAIDSKDLANNVKEIDTQITQHGTTNAKVVQTQSSVSSQTTNDENTHSSVRSESINEASPNAYEDPFVSAASEKMGRYKAFKALFKRWNMDYPEEPFVLACDHASSNGLSCLHKQGNWRSVFKLNRPAVLTLVNTRGEEFFIAILSVSDDVAVISYADNQYSIPLTTIDRYWLGEYSILWKLPPYKKLKSPQAHERAEKKWVSERLLTIANANSLNEGGQSVLIEPFEARVKRFQRDIGLEADGIVGALTLIELNSKLDSSIPMLINVPYMSAQRQQTF